MSKDTIYYNIKRDKIRERDAIRSIKLYNTDNNENIDLEKFELVRNTSNIISKDTAIKINGICIEIKNEKDAIFAVKDPSQKYIYDLLEWEFLCEKKEYNIILLKATDFILNAAIDYVYHLPPELHSLTWKDWIFKKRFLDNHMKLKDSELERDPQSAFRTETSSVVIKGNVISFVDKIIMNAINLGASDIHIESLEDGLKIRYRIDGVLLLQEIIKDKDLAKAINIRIKIMANMDITQTRISQGGRMSFNLNDLAYDLRVSIVPVQTGESIVLRLLNKGAFNLTLSVLGFSEKQLEIYRRIVENPYGIILVSGPTGSGKSTTLYASLKEINRPDRKLITIEDPIEYHMPDIVQVQVNTAPREHERRVTFAKALREFLRQDPDVILVGEIRDEETAEISVQASLTGHLVFSTIHTNDAVGIISRLKDLNIKQFLIASSLIGGIAQRLVRVLCKHCKEEIQLTDKIKEIFERVNIHTPLVFKAKGCKKCSGTGYKGRMGLFEILEISPDIRDMIEKNTTAGEIFRTAYAKGMNTIYEDGIKKAAMGITSLDEVRRVCSKEYREY